MTTTTNLIERLYEIGKNDDQTIAHQAADLLEAQAKQIEALQAEWKPTPCEATLNACITYLLHGKADFSGLPEGLVNTFKFRIEALQVDAERLHRLAAMEASLADENKVCYYLRNLPELDRLIKLDGLAKNVS